MGLRERRGGGPVTGEWQSTTTHEPDAPWADCPWWARVLLTPVALGLDLLTAPVQCCLSDDDDCDDRRR